MNNILGCLANKDSVSYFCLFPPFDTLWAQVIYNPDHSPEAVKELNHLKAHPQALLEFDPFYNRNIMARFSHILRKGEDSGIHWNGIVMQRYELNREVNTHRELIGYDRIVPERFKGYLFVRDVMGRLTFCITITEIQKINGYFLGGQVINILEASSVDEFLRKEEDEKKYFDWLSRNHGVDSTAIDSAGKKKTDSIALKDPNKQDFLSVSNGDDDTVKARREVVARKYYEGKFDDEIPVKLFVRYMKDARTGVVNGYDGLYKFGDQPRYIKLHITKNLDGKWLMEDDLPLGIMELELKDKTYTGSWNNSENQTGYDVELKETAASQRKIEQLDKILETGVYGRVDEAATLEKKPIMPVDETDGVNPANSHNDDEDQPQQKPKEEKPKKEKPKRRKDDDE